MDDDTYLRAMIDEWLLGGSLSEDDVRLSSSKLRPNETIKPMMEQVG